MKRLFNAILFLGALLFLTLSFAEGDKEASPVPPVGLPKGAPEGFEGPPNGEGDAWEKKGEDFENAKSRHLKGIEEHIGILQDKKACISKAKSFEEMRKCRQDGRAEMKHLRKESKEGREKFQREKKKLRDERKSRREAVKSDAELQGRRPSGRKNI